MSINGHFDYADDSREDSVVYTNGIVPDSIFTDGCQWQIAGSDGTLTECCIRYGN